MALTDEVQEHLNESSAWQNSELGQDAVWYVAREIPSLADADVPPLTTEQEDELNTKILRITAEFMEANGITADALKTKHRAACERAVREGRATFHRGVSGGGNPYVGSDALTRELNACWRNGYEEAELAEHEEQGTESTWDEPAD